MVSSADVPDQFMISWKACEESTTRSSGTVGSSNRFTRRTSSSRLCSACDSCRSARVKCSGGNPCQRCKTNSSKCHYSVSLRKGRLKATKTGESSETNTQPPRANQSSARHDERVDVGTRWTPPNGFPPGSSRDYSEPTHTMEFNLSPLFTNDLDLNSFNSMPATLSSTERPDTLTKPLSPHSLLSDMSSYDPQGDPDFGFATSYTAPYPSASSTTMAFPLDFASPSQGTGCSCLKSQLHCIAELCGPREDVDKLGLDIILETARETSTQTSQRLSCTSCSKGSTDFILTTIVLQRVLNMFCGVAKNGFAYIEHGKLGIGMFQLSEEDDRAHKRLLVISGLKKIEAVVDDLGDTVRDFQGGQLLQRKAGELATETGRSNLKWVLDAVRNMKARLKAMVSLIEAPDWGLTRTDLPRSNI